MERFLSLPRYQFTDTMIELAPNEPGIFGLFDGPELIYIGCALGGSESTLRADAGRGATTRPPEPK